MDNVGLIFLVFAFVFACIATRWVFPPWNFLAVAVAFWIFSELVGGLTKAFH